MYVNGEHVDTIGPEGGEVFCNRGDSVRYEYVDALQGPVGNILLDSPVELAHQDRQNASDLWKKKKGWYGHQSRNQTRDPNRRRRLR